MAKYFSGFPSKCLLEIGLIIGQLTSFEITLAGHDLISRAWKNIKTFCQKVPILYFCPKLAKYLHCSFFRTQPAVK